MNIDELVSLFDAEFTATRFKATLEGDILMQKAPNREFVSIGKINDGKDAEVIVAVLNMFKAVISDRDSICNHLANTRDELRSLKRELQALKLIMEGALIQND